jgi:hypothetical protein
MGDRRHATLLWVGIAAAGGAIRFLRFDHFSFWLDEILEVYTVCGSWSSLWTSLRWQGLHAPLDYILQKLWFSVAAGGSWHRALPAVWGTLSIALLGILLARRAGVLFGVLAAAFLALSPFHVRYSQEVRPYSLGTLFLVAALLALDVHLERPRLPTLAAFYACALGCLYSLYLAAFILALAAPAMVIEDCAAEDPGRRAAARRFLRWSPVHAAVIAAGFFPWWPVAAAAMRSAPMTTPSALSAARAFRYLGYFGFNPHDGYPLGRQGVFFACLVALGAVCAVRTRGVRFLLSWALLGMVGIEILEHRHSTFDSIFHWLLAGMALAPLAALPVAALVRRRRTLLLGGALAVVTAVLYARGLTRYFEAGRPDWRPLARDLLARPLATYADAAPPRGQLFVENQYSQLCLAYYLVGPQWLCCRTEGDIQIVNVDGDRARLEQVWRSGADAWLVLAAGPRSPALRDWAARFPGREFPQVELGAILRYLGRPIPPESGEE